MVRSLSAAALLTALTTFVAAMALRATDATLAVAAVAALAVLFTWYANLDSTAEHSSLGLVNPAASIALAIVGRQPWTAVLPGVAAHLIGAVVGGLLALALDDRLGDTLVFAEPSLVLAGTGAAVVGVIVAWVTLSIDGGGSESLAVVPVIVGGAIVPLGLITVFHPAAVVGLATAGLVPWDAALVAAAVTLVATVVGAYAVSLLVPAE